MNRFAIGQRYMSLAEPELGLGIIENVEDKIIQVLYPAAEESRRYGSRTAPLKRIIFEVGDEITLRDQQQFTINDISTNPMGLVTYIGEAIQADETQLLDSISFHHPEEKILNGLTDHPGLFQLRQKAFEYRSWLGKNPHRGFIGGRVSLIEHQLYLAEKVSRRMIPRVLLADEVGLGKTIESGLILNNLFLTGRIRRVLIVTPNTLNYQWFVEMLRKYNQTYSVVNEQTELELDSNPFDQNNLVITSMQLLCGSEKAREMASSANWDMLVVDEAHKLFWRQGNPSTQYKVIESLAGTIPGLILLTATPEIYGLEGHFSHLRLIDPSRFNDYEEYLKEQDLFAQHATKAKELLAQGHSSDSEEIQTMIDRHGPGRVYFRNTREMIDHQHRYFPERKLLSHPLDNKKNLTTTDQYQKTFYQLKLKWLIDYLDENTRKTLLICHKKETVLQIEKDLKKLTIGNKVGLFHEDLSFMARDRQAAFFRDEDGANILLCSEIGSEGRNFQFCQDLILFDLPVNPDLLEQRIGRLDRIGQQHSINIHVPYIENTWEETLFHWYHDVFNSFTASVKGAGHISERFKEQLDQVLAEGKSGKKLFEEAKTAFTELTKKQEEGRNILLELNSFNRPAAESIIDDIKSIDHDPKLREFLELVYSQFGVDVEDINEASQFIKPGDNMFIPHFPHLTDDGMTYTFDRKYALEREEIQFMSWDHPMVEGILDLIVGEEFGNTTIMTRRNGQVKNFLELYFNLQTSAPGYLQINRFLPATPIRVLIDVKGDDYTEKWSKELLDEKLIEADQTIKNKLMGIQKSKIKELLARGLSHAGPKKDNLKEKASVDVEHFYNKEINRLKELQKINHAVSDREIEILAGNRNIILEHIKEASLSLDSIRFIY
jgi:ATP-dependent helicase HepA